MAEAIVIGAGLAGCEAAMVLSKLGIRVILIEMKPDRRSPAHKADTFGELVCSNSLKSDDEGTAAGILKREMRLLGSAVMESADQTKLPAGNALAVDRTKFSEKLTELIKAQKNIHIEHAEATEIPASEHVIVATGPLTDGALALHIEKIAGRSLSFFDAASPIVSTESIDYEHAFLQGRYGQDDDYLNCPLSKEEYQQFFEAITVAERAPQHDFDARFFESCMPIEAIAARGFKTPLFGPMSPKGITDPKTGRRPFAVVQLRRENKEATMWNLVGFQTNLKFGEQKRVFGLIPALKNAEYLRYGVMHRNSYLPAGTLDDTLAVRQMPSVRFAGQITGVEGYMESAAM
ncbi:MAG: methylenetetrahydrofolate--tRNA-(uracil(54)-C(5))-methyltransferase (FADH(2)-oxidizing) TrmFO, partial [Clostridia bacterium]|nr:methylenetetrahydrofolate--tRNA-(uracil(54)-C(5))-methyltransferase (FADH(2)-oxidizing) TrmFO [Clostridia bacterium]